MILSAPPTPRVHGAHPIRIFKDEIRWSAPSISKEVTYSTENWTEFFSENSLRSIAKKILSVKINAVQFSTLIYLDVYFELFYLRISYLIQDVTLVMEFLLLFNVAKNVHSTYSKKLFYLLNIIFWSYSVWNKEAINFGQNLFLPTKEETP